MSAPAYVLDEADYRAAESVWRHFRNEALGPEEIADELDYWRQELALLQGDLDVSDFTRHDKATIRNGIAYAEHRLTELMLTAERMLRARTAHPTRRLPARDLKPRFEAAKLVDLVDLAQTLTGQQARKTGARYRIRCPFHDDEQPSLVIYSPGLGWHCFVCGIGGDAVNFVAKLKKIPAAEALALVERLCDMRAA